MSIGIFIGAAAFGAVAGQFRYVQAAGNTYLQMDADGDGLAEQYQREGQTPFAL